METHENIGPKLSYFCRELCALIYVSLFVTDCYDTSHISQTRRDKSSGEAYFCLIENIGKRDMGKKKKKIRHLYSAFIQRLKALYNTLWGTLPDCLFIGANCSHAVHNRIRENSGIYRCPQNRISDKPSHRGQCALLFSNSVWVL